MRDKIRGEVHDIQSRSTSQELPEGERGQFDGLASAATMDERCVRATLA